MPAIDVTDADFMEKVIDRSNEVPVVIDVWAEWCGPCRTLGPIIEKVVDETDGKVVLAKVDADHNPQVSQALRVQGIPAVFVARHGRVAPLFTGAYPEDTVRKAVQSVLPTPEEEKVDALLAAGDEASLREALEVDPGHPVAVVALAELLATSGDEAAVEEALQLLERIPESSETRRVAALARVGATVAPAGAGPGRAGDDGVEAKLDALLPKVKADDEARQEYVDLLELLGPADPRTAVYRKKLTAQLF
jgi:putative thioredoxin